MAFRALPPAIAGYTTKLCALHPTHLLLLATITGVKSYLLNNSTVLWSEAKVCTVHAHVMHLPRGTGPRVALHIHGVLETGMKLPFRSALNESELGWQLPYQQVMDVKLVRY